MNKVIPGDPEFDATLQTQDVTELLKRAERQVEWNEIVEGLKEQKSQIKIVLNDHTRESDGCQVYMWYVKLVVGRHTVWSWRSVSGVGDLIRYYHNAVEFQKILHSVPLEYQQTPELDSQPLDK